MLKSLNMNSSLKLCTFSCCKMNAGVGKYLDTVCAVHPLSDPSRGPVGVRFMYLRLVSIILTYYIEDSHGRQLQIRIFKRISSSHLSRPKWLWLALYFCGSCVLYLFGSSEFITATHTRAHRTEYLSTAVSSSVFQLLLCP